jgi:hypothetical protein
MALKKITYNGSSKVIIRLCEVVNDLIDRGGGGHTIQNSSGTDMTARTNLQFTGASVSDDAVNDRTVVDVPTYSDATQSASGLMSASDKTKLDGIASGAEVNVQSNWTEADNTSDAYIANKPNLATVATSGLYSDLSGTPSLATVATSGSYNDLSNKPTIPTVNDATLTLTQGGSTLGTFTANSESNVSIEVGGGGHTIWDRVKTALTSRSKLWFKDANVTDASADGATKVEVVTELASENAFDALATDGTADGVYTFPDSGTGYLTADMVGYGSGTVKDALDSVGENVSVTADGVKTYATLLTELKALADVSKVNDHSYLSVSGNLYPAIYPSGLVFAGIMDMNATTMYTSVFKLISAKFIQVTETASGNGFSDKSSSVAPNTTKFILYYK